MKRLSSLLSKWSQDLNISQPLGEMLVNIGLKDRKKLGGHLVVTSSFTSEYVSTDVCDRESGF